jgi:nucleoside-diphosphate-sugar epimerase
MDRLKILITGGNGYIAKSLFNALNEKYDITLITRETFDLRDQLATSRFFENKFFDIVIHTAVAGGSRLRIDLVDAMDANLTMYYNLLAQRSHYNKFIHFGSGAEDYMSDQFYGKSKSIIAASMLEKERFYNIKVFGVFDENELDTRFIKANIINYIKQKPLVVYHEKKMTFFYMKDLIMLVDHHIKTDPRSLMPVSYCGYVTDYSLTEIAEHINELGDYRLNILVGKETAPHNYISNYNAGYDLPYIGLKKGIQETYNKLKNEY